jgi:hypothetical protein
MKLIHATFFVFVSLTAHGQSLPQATTEKGSTLPRSFDGKPDLSGIWQAFGVALFGETGELRPGQGTKSNWGPPVGPAPYRKELEGKVAELASDNRKDPNVRCKMAGVPRITGSVVPLEIIQTPKKVAILYESGHAFRSIPVDGKPHPSDLDPSYMGHSTGRWDGDTFEVDVVGFNNITWLPGAGHFHSEALHVVERYTLQPDKTIYYEATMEDPAVFTKPWAYRLILRHPPRDERIMESDCTENNQDLEHIVPSH